MYITYIPPLIKNVLIGHNWHWVVNIFSFFSQNSLTNIDKSIRLAPALTQLNLSDNSIEDIDNLTGLPHLRKIDLSRNSIKNIENIHTKIGQILTLDLSNNKIRNLHGMSKLYSVMKLDVSNNKLRTLADVTTVTQLPCIEHLTLSPNKLNNEVDYRWTTDFVTFMGIRNIIIIIWHNIMFRLKVLEGYGARCREVTLDQVPTSQEECDKVSVLMALRSASV